MPYSSEAVRWGIAKETVRLTAEAAPTDYISVEKSSDMVHKMNPIEDKCLRGIKAAFPQHAGKKTTEGKVSHPVRVSSLAYFLNMILGAPVTAEQSVVTVEAGVNDKIDFTEDGGSEVSATLTAGAYPIGASSATAGTFCKLVKDQLEAVNGASTYTVAYDSATRKFTITKDTGVFVILWLTGTNTATSAAALLGFNATDTSSAISAVSDVAVSARAFKHTFGLPSSIQPPTYTIFVDRGLSVKKYNGVAVGKMSLKSSADGQITHESDLIGLNEAAGTTWTPSYANESNPLAFLHSSVKVGGVANTDIKDWSLELDSGLFAKMVQSASQTPVDVLAPGVLKVSGGFSIYFESETERAKFLANTSNSLELVVEGEIIAGGVKDTLNILLPKIHYKAYPYGELDGMLGASVSFEAAYDIATSKLITVDVINKIASI